jgi:GWxTD domain-containing protein
LSLAEAAADDEAIGKVKDRTFYAGLLVDFASRGARTGFVGVEMARGGTVTHRIDRLLGDTKLPQRSSFMRRLALASVFVPILALSAAAWTVRAEQKTFFAKPLAVSLPPQSTPQTPTPTTRPTTPAPSPAVPAAQTQTAIRQAEDSALSTWIEREVPDVATQQERDAFQTLRTDEERTQFIASFWLRRDPTPGTVQNEFREEYDRRVALSNQRFAAKNGTPGALTDRGRIMILHGEPDEVETHAMGGTYIRDGVRTSTFPFERWRYRFIEGIGNNVILEFVDLSMSGDYILTFDPSAKDALLHAPGLDSPLPAVAPEAPFRDKERELRAR